MGAEGKIGLTGITAGGAGKRLPCAASRTESKTALNIETAAGALHRTRLTKPRCTAISAATSRPQTGDKHEPAAPGPQALNKWRTDDDDPDQKILEAARLPTTFEKRITTKFWVMNIDNISYATTIEEERKGSADGVEQHSCEVSGVLQDHIQQQIGEDGLYENASDYIRALIRRDLQTRDEAWDGLQKELAPAMRADDSEFVVVSAEDVIRRNKRR
nr:hypothetical protein [Rhizobium leguminosarum]